MLSLASCGLQRATLPRPPYTPGARVPGCRGDGCPVHAGRHALARAGGTCKIHSCPIGKEIRYANGGKGPK